MLKNLITILFILSILAYLINHPLLLMIVIFTQVITNCIMISYMTFNSWYSYILFLVMISGLLILFLYMTSMSSNNKFPSLTIKHISIFILFTLFYYNVPLLFNNHFYNESNNIFFSFYLSLNKFMIFPMNIFLSTLIIYLLITLMSIVKITKFKKGPIRSLN
uniref:NADH dehydrogenase subunit 6 n=1 Tax=Ophrygonius sp. TaxID=2897803 RepID=UPI001EE02493|nr:NADH dehydrogenase subunit 6 [Ophrygonius sp.]UFK32146.1 NADH dehydrogenase subunit 6 [Ophrygonius sp.]UIN24741.1 NADH dehydrogenase subunit 6 [Ophrygonius sp.]